MAGRSAIPACGVGQQKRKRVEEIFGWTETVRRFSRVDILLPGLSARQFLLPPEAHVPEMRDGSLECLARFRRPTSITLESDQRAHFMPEPSRSRRTSKRQRRF
jgi:hypothetical protein